MQRNRSQAKKSNSYINNNQVNQRRDIDIYEREKNLLNLFKDDFSDPFGDDFFGFGGFGRGQKKQRDEVGLFSGFDSMFNNFRDMDRDIFSKY
jgi:hypothetical protein